MLDLAGLVHQAAPAANAPFVNGLQSDGQFAVWDDRNQEKTIWIADLLTGQARILARASAGMRVDLPDIDGNTVAWTEFASGMAWSIVVRDLSSGETHRIEQDPHEGPASELCVGGGLVALAVYDRGSTEAKRHEHIEVRRISDGSLVRRVDDLPEVLEIAFADGDLLWTQGRHTDIDGIPFIIRPAVMLSRASDPRPVAVAHVGHEVSIGYGRIAWDADPTPADADGWLYGLRIFTSASTPLAPVTLGRVPELPASG